MILAALLQTLISVVVVSLILSAIGSIFVIAGMIIRNYNLRRLEDRECRVEIEEIESCWDSLPPKWHPTVERYAGPRDRSRLP